ncbi:hypothetical protein I3J27_21555 [Bradyrhizobium xenonodulans]|uniref:Uncharacterized protein n=1 Tax=Bradyrhizobium xenonodulans TaxID=2736875 RepID=A0ABY7MBG2_9BRAD|nr:hypothetical protein [Bradyrhizobium xenonodulans]WBL75622.1 hypothetical protein I3J27_21555 [Bradyrhizobium xenonodulans]
MTELVRYEAARRALAEAVAVDEVKAIHDHAEALRHAARIAGDKQLEIQAAQIRFRAQRRFGELMEQQHAAGKVARGGRPRSEKTSDELSGVSGEPEELPEITLRDIGVTHRFSSQAQKLAALPPEKFEALVERHAEEMLSGKGRVAMDLLKIGAEEDGRVHRRDLASALSSASAMAPSGRLYPAGYGDPPWKRQGGIGNRAYENHYPTMPWPEILDYLKRAGEALLPDAWFWMWIPRAHLLAKIPVKTEVMLADGEGVLATVDLPLAYACMLALGMDSYSTCYVWTKTDEEHPDVSGSGLLVWDQDELLLQFKRGKGLPKPDASEKFGSNHRERPREHSRKPDHYRNMIATMVGKDSDGAPLPVLELFARVDAEHPLPENWDAWGNQAGVALTSAISTPTDAAPSPSSHGLPEPSGEDETAAADATSQGASAAAAVEAPYNADDVVTIDQLAGSEWLAPSAPSADDLAAEAQALTGLQQLKILSDFCHARRDLAPVIGPLYVDRGLSYVSNEQWQLRGAGWDRLRELEAATARPVAPAILTEPYRAPQPSLFDVARQLDDAPPAEVVDGVLQTRLPVDADELAEQLALLAIDAGEQVDGEMARHLVGRDLLIASTRQLKITERGRAFLAQLVAPASVQQQGEIAR